MCFVRNTWYRRKKSRDLWAGTIESLKGKSYVQISREASQVTHRLMESWEAEKEGDSLTGDGTFYYCSERRWWAACKWVASNAGEITLCLLSFLHSAVSDRRIINGQIFSDRRCVQTFQQSYPAWLEFRSRRQRQLHLPLFTNRIRNYYIYLLLMKATKFLQCSTYHSRINDDDWAIAETVTKNQWPW